MEKTTIEYYARQNYGKTQFYIKNERENRIIGQLLRQKTISRDQIRSFEQLGLKFELVLE